MFTFVIAYNVVEFDFNNWTVGIQLRKRFPLMMNTVYFIAKDSIVKSPGLFRMLCNEKNSAVPSITQAVVHNTWPQAE